MANKPLQSIKFPGLSDTYTTPQVDNTLTTTGAAADAKKVGDELTSVKQDLSESGSFLEIWKNGGIASVTGENADSASNRIRTGFLSDLFKEVTPDNGYKIAIFAYDKTTSAYSGCWDGSSYVKGTITWFETSVVLTSISLDHLVRIVGSLVSDEDITTSSADHFVFDYSMVLKNESDIENLQATVTDISENENLFAFGIDGFRIDGSGVNLVDPEYFVSPYVPIIVGETYEKNSPTPDAYHRFAMYDSSKAFVRKIDDANTVTVNSGEAFLRFCGLIEEKNTTVLNLSGGVTAIDKVARSGQDDIFPVEFKQALLQLAEKIAYVDENGQDYYNSLYSSLYPKAVSSITATFSQGSEIIYNNASIESLRSYLTVKANYDDGTNENVTTYTLSGNLTVGQSTITVKYKNKTSSFTVNVTNVIPAEYQQVEYIQSNGTQAIQTNIAPRNTRTVVDFEIVSKASSRDNFITGVYNDNNQRYYAAWINSSGKYVAVNRGNTQKWSKTSDTGRRHVIDYNNARHQVLFDGNAVATDDTFAVTSGDNKIAIFCRGRDTTSTYLSTSSIAKIYGVKYENNANGDALGEFYPCYRKADGVIGMYDAVTQTFYTDILEGDPFTKGDDV